MTQIEPTTPPVYSISQIDQSNRSVKLIGQIDRSNRSVANRSNQAVSKSIQHSLSSRGRLVMVWLRVLSWAGIFLFLLLLRLLVLLLFTIGDVAQSVECVVRNDEAPGSKPGFSKVSLKIIPALASDRLLTSKHRLFLSGILQNLADQSNR